MPRERRQRRAAEATSVSRDSDDIRKSFSGEKSVSSLWLQSCRQEGLSRFRHDQETVDHQTKMSRIQTCQRQRLLRDHAVDGRASQAVSGCSYRLSLVFIGSSPLSKLRSPGLPGLYLYIDGIYIYVYIHMYIYIYTICKYLYNII